MASPDHSPPSSTPNSSSSSDAETEDGEEILVTLASTQSLVTQALSNPTKLSAAEVALCKQRLDINMPKLAHMHLVLISETLDAVLTQATVETQQAARELIIERMMKHTGISAWAVPLRKVVESLEI